MANNKKFIAKNGILTTENVVIGTTTDNGVDKLQVTGSTTITQSTAATPSLDVINTGGTGNSIVAQFTGDSDSLQIINFGTGDYSLVNSQQGNGIKFYDDTTGIEITYNSSADLAFSSTGIDFKRSPTVNGDTIWHAGNDGANTGLDADLLDGLHAYQFLRSDTDDTMNGSLTITGNLTVNGTTTTVNTETILLADNIITLNSNYTGSTPTENAGFEVERGTLTNSSLVWDETNDWWKLTSAGTDLGRIITTADEGSGNGFDADTVDGLHAAQFLRSDADDFATGNIHFRATITVGNNTAAGATIYMDGQNANRSIYSNNGEIGFLNAAAAYAAYSDASSNWRVLNNVYGKQFIDADNNTFLLDPDSTSVLNNIDLDGQIRHNGDTDTYITFPATDQFEVRTAGTQRLLVTTTSVTGSVDFVAPRFVDADNNTYYADPNSTSVFNTLGIDSDLFHNGDTDNKISFTTDTQTFTTGNVARLTINNTSVTGSVDFIAPRFVDSGSGSYYADFANTAVSIAAAGTINAASANLYSGGATNDFNIGRNVNERFNLNVTDGQGYIRYYQDETDSTNHSVNFEIISTGTGTKQFNFNRDINTTGNVIGVEGAFSGSVFAEVFYDYTDQTYFADLNATGNSIKVAGTIQAGNGSLAAPAYTFGSDTNIGMYRYATDVIGFSAGNNDEFRIYSSYTLSPGSSRAPIFYDSDNTAYYGNFAGDSVMNTIDIDDYVRHNGNTTTYIGFPANNQLVVYTNGAQRLLVTDTGITAAVDVTAPNMYAARFIDSGNNLYYADPASTSILSQIDIDDYIRHNGNTTSYFGFSANNIFKIFTNGTERVNIDDNSADFAQNVYAPTYYTNDYLIHNGDTDTYIGFDAADNFGAWVAGSQKFDISSTVAWLNNVNVGIGTTTPSRLQYGTADPRLHVLQTAATGSYNLVARFEAGSDADNTGAAILINHSNDRGLLIEAGRQTGDVGISHLGIVQSNGTNTRILTLLQGGKVGVNNATPTAALSVQTAGTMGANPYAVSNKLMDFGDAGTVDASIRGDNSGNLWIVGDSGASIVFADTGAGVGLAVDTATTDVIIGDLNAQIATPDGTPTFLSSLSANKLHVNGGIQLNGITDAISLYAADAGNTAINEATFLAVNELGFSAGGGFYMDETTTVKVRGNKALSTTGNVTAGNMYAARFYDSDDTNYYGDFATTSRVNDISLVGQIIHDGDTNTYLDFNAADSFQVVTGGTARLTANNTSITATDAFDAPIFRDSGNTAYTLNGNTTSAWRLSTPTGYLDFGSMNTSYVHFQTDRAQFYFQKFVKFDGGGIGAYSNNDYAYFPRYYDYNDNFYYAEPASVSRFQSLTFGNPGNGANTKGRWLSIEGDTDASGEGSGRIFFAEHNSTVGSMDMYGVALAYRGGNASINSVTGQPVTLTGLNNGEWGLLGYDNNVNGNWAMKGPRDSSYVQARASFRAPIFYDSDNTAYYGNFAGTSLTNTMRAQKFEVDNATYFIDGISGEYGSIRVEGTNNSWAGYAINDDWVFMSSGPTQAGIYNDTDNEWALLANQNGATELYGNGVHQLSAQNGYGYAPNSMRSPIFYDSNNTAWYGDFAGQSKFNDVAIGNQGILNAGSPLTVYDDQRYLVGLRNSTADGNYPWLVHDTRNSQSNLILHFNGIADRFWFEETGDFQAYGSVIAADFQINGGNENIGILKSYGSGLGDTMLFDGTEYWEKRVIQPMQQGENNATTVTAEYVKVTDGPFASSYALQTSSYRTFDSDYIPVEPGEEIYGEIAVKYISGSGGLVYMGVRRYDKDKNPIAGNDGITYFVVSANNHTGGWTTFSGHTTIPTTHTPYNGSDGGGCRYVRVIVLMNYNAGGAVRQYGPPILKRTNHLSNIVTQQINASGNVYAPRYYDSDNTGFYLDPASTSYLNDVRASIYYDRDNTAYYVNPAATSNLLYTKINTAGSSSGTRALTIKDSTQSEINFGSYPGAWTSALQIQNNDNTDFIWISPLQDGNNARFRTAGMGLDFYTNGANDAGTYSGTIDNGAFYSPRFYDSDNNSYYGDFASTSVLNKLHIGSTASFTDGNDPDISVGTVNVATKIVTPRLVFLNDAAGDDNYIEHTDTNTAYSVAGQSMGAWYTFVGDKIGATGTNSAGLVASGLLTTFIEAGNQIRSPIYYDQNDTAYYGDFASTSVTNYMRANRFELGTASAYMTASTSNYGTVKVEGVTGSSGSYAGYAIRDDWVFMSAGAGSAGIYNDTNNEWAQIYEQNASVVSYYNGTWEERTENGYVRARGSYRAPIFYDQDNTGYYLDPNSTSNLLNVTINGTLNLNGYDQNNGVAGQWYQTSTYVYDATNGTRYYWIRVGQAATNGTKGILEYYCKADVNYSTNAIGRVVFSSWNNSSISVDHHTTGPQNGVTPEVRIDNSNYLWLRMNGSAWDSWLRWRWIRADSVTREDGSTKVDSVGGAVPANSSPTILSGQQTRATLGNVTGATITNTTNYVGGLYSRGAVYGSTFYDSDDTNWYANPNSTSRMNDIDLNNLDMVGGGSIQLYTSSGNVRGYIQATETNDYHLKIATSGGEDIAFMDGGLSGDWNMIVRGNGQVLINSRLDVPIMYDRNDTNYYADPASTTKLNILQFNTPANVQGVSAIGNFGQWQPHGTYSDFNAAISYWGWNYVQGNTNAPNTDSAQWYRGRFSLGDAYGQNYGGSDYWLELAYPRSSYAGSVGQAWMRVAEGGTPGGWAQIGSYIRTTGQAGQDYRAPVFYDSNDTNYYVDGNTWSRLWGLGTFYLRNNYDVATDHPYGMYFANGLSTAYAIYREPGAWTNPYPDLRIAFHTGIKMGANAGYNGMRFYDDYTMATQVMSINNSSDGLGANNVYINNNLQVGQSVRSEIWYDTNNTGYYIDGNNTSSLNTLTVDRINMRDMGDFITLYGNDNQYHSISSRNATGGAADDIRINSYGAVYINLDSNNNNTSGADFIIGRHGADTGTIANQDLFAAYGDAMYVYTGFSFRAPIFYDSNDTGYYADPNSWSRFNNFRGTEVYASSWFRNDAAGTGLYNQTTGQHLYSPSAAYWHMTSNNNNNAISLQFRGAYNGTQKAWIYGDGSWQGFLNSAGSWKIRVIHSDTYSPSIRWEENGDETWTGNPGNDVGKIEYHANRFYIVSGANSDRIVQFRRDGTDRSYIANDGVFVGTATSARWADLAERYEADAIYEAGTVLAIGGDKEVTLYQPGMPLAGAISVKPAYRMNDENYGNDNSIESKMNPFVALKGRIPVKVNGDVKKGQWVVADRDGKGRGVDYGTPGINTFDIIGIALGNSENGEVEVKI